MTTMVLREIGIALAFFAILLWAFGIHWETFVTGSALVGLDGYMAHRRGQRTREAISVAGSVLTRRGRLYTATLNTTNDAISE